MGIALINCFFIYEFGLPVYTNVGVDLSNPLIPYVIMSFP